MNQMVNDMTDKLLTLDELSDALGGLGLATIYRHIKVLPGFPQPVKVGAVTCPPRLPHS